MRRTSIVKLVTNEETQNKLKLLCSLSAKLWNEVNYERRRQFFSKRGVDLKGTYKLFYEKYKKLIGSATVQQVLNKNNEAWRSFFKLLEKKKGKELPQFIIKVNPPGYKKENKQRKLWTVLRNDQYKIEDGTLILKGLGAIGRIVVKFKGRVHIKGKQGRLEIIKDGDSWYVHISFEVEKKAVRKEWRKVPLSPKGNLSAGIDIGINNLLAIYTEDGKARVFNGRPLNTIAFYYKHRIAKYQSILNKYGIRASKKLRALYNIWTRRAKHFIDTQVRRAIDWLYNNNVSTVYVGYPKGISQDNGNFYTVNLWHYNYLLKRVYEVAEEYGIKVNFVDESYTSTTCPIHGNGCGKRMHRGLFKCTTLNKVFNADLVGGYNILVKSITLSPERDRGNGLKTQPKAELKDVALNLPVLAEPSLFRAGRGSEDLIFGSYFKI